MLGNFYSCDKFRISALFSFTASAHGKKHSLPVECNCRDGDGGDEDAGGLEGAEHFAGQVVRAERPVVGELLHQRERHRDQTQHQVGHGQVHDEHVARGAHGGLANHCNHHQAIAAGAEHDEQSVGGDQRVVGERRFDTAIGRILGQDVQVDERTSNVKYPRDVAERVVGRKVEPSHVELRQIR